MIIQYCQFCGNKISEDELERGLAFDTGNGDFTCPICALKRNLRPSPGIIEAAQKRKPSGIRAAVQPPPRGSGIRAAVQPPSKGSGRRDAVQAQPRGSGIRTAVQPHPRQSGVSAGIAPRKTNPLAYIVAFIGIAVFGGAIYWSTQKEAPSPAPPKVEADTNKPPPDVKSITNLPPPAPGQPAQSAAIETTYDPLKTLLIAHWKFDETSGNAAIDSGASRADGMLNGKVTHVPGVDGMALQFDGQTGYVSTGKSLVNNFPSFSFAMWVKLSAPPAGRTGLAGQNDALELGFWDDQLHIWTPGGGELSTRWSYPLNEWHHIAAVGTSNRVSLYLDGKQAALHDQHTENYGSSRFLFNIGGGGILDETGNFLNGALDDVRLYARDLSEEQVKMLYKMGAK